MSKTTSTEPKCIEDYEGLTKAEYRAKIRAMTPKEITARFKCRTLEQAKEKMIFAMMVIRPSDPERKDIVRYYRDYHDRTIELENMISNQVQAKMDEINRLLAIVKLP